MIAECPELRRLGVQKARSEGEQDVSVSFSMHSRTVSVLGSGKHHVAARQAGAKLPLESNLDLLQFHPADLELLHALALMLIWLG